MANLNVAWLGAYLPTLYQGDRTSQNTQYRHPFSTALLTQSEPD